MLGLPSPRPGGVAVLASHTETSFLISRCWLPWGGALLLLVPSACTDGESRSPCLRPQPAFRVQVTAGGSELPGDTRVVVQYQGTVTERYALRGPPSNNEDVCCRPLAEPVLGDLPAVGCGAPTSGVSDAALEAGCSERDGGCGAAPPSEVRALVCQLWTDGEAEIRISATGYEPIERILDATIDEARCGLETSDVRLDLAGPDAGP